MNILKRDLTSAYVKMALLNLLIVALLGVLMRYKIIFELPLINQKYAQHSHSHFAFIGWVSHTLFFLIFNFTKGKLNLIKLTQNKDNGTSSENQTYYNFSVLLNILLGYALFLSFLFSGYSILSIILSTLSIFCSYYFAYLSFKDLNILYANFKLSTSSTSQQTNLFELISYNLLKFSLVFMVLSSFGTFALAFMIASKVMNQEWYLSSVYFYLHFQYNGWFFFGLLGLLLYFINEKGAHSNDLNNQNINDKSTIFGIEAELFGKLITVLLITVIPNYLLSILWAKLPEWTYYVALISVITQLVIWYFILFNLVKSKSIFGDKSQNGFSSMFKLLMQVVLLSIFIKITLQSLVLIPFMAKLAYEYRTIVIAYLHLVLLCVITIGLIAYLYEKKLIPNSKSMKIGIYHFVVGVLLNEIILAAQGFASFSYVFLPYINEILFANTVLMFVGTLIMFKALLKS